MNYWLGMNWFPGINAGAEVAGGISAGLEGYAVGMKG